MRPGTGQSVAALVFACACNRVFGLDETVARFDAGPADASSCNGSFMSPQIDLVEFANGPIEYDATLRGDHLELFFVKEDPAHNDELRIFHATRTAEDQPFSELGTLFPRALRINTDPALTADGLRLVYLYDGNEPREVTRPTVDDPFGPQTLLIGFDDIVGYPASLDVSFDGKTVYFANFVGDLWQATRPALDRPFENARQVLGKAAFPSVSPDQLEVYYNATTAPNQVWRSVRTSTLEPFDMAGRQLIIDNGADPDVGSDGTTMIVSVDGGLRVMSRTCAP